MSAIPDRNYVEAGDSFEHWHHVTCRNYAVSEFSRQSDGPFSGRIAFRPFGALALTEASSSMGAAQLVRGAAEIRRDPCDHFMLFLVTDGQIGIVQDGREARAQTGDLFVYDEARPLVLDFHEHYETVMLNIPRPLLEARSPETRGLLARRLGCDSPTGALASAIVRQLVGFDEQTRPEVLARINASTLDILSMALGVAAGEENNHSAGRRLLSKARAYLLANLHDPSLNVETIANAMNMSSRTLNRIFAAEGSTPMRWLWQQRLAACNKALAEGHIKSVTEAALAFGFSDVSHFSRAFKLAFGKSPRELKRG